ncbi:hypothetical protein RDI58_017485 [Solanum bulbocastanum]|uniref:Uncharacterized protein n=1 Tax=Solanum bulbocastanum TaxID=147425 RepID=A0AAN8YA08_SOLBU
MTQKKAEEIHIYDKEHEEDNEECNSTDDEEPINTFARQTSWNEQEVKDPVTSHKMSFKRTDEPFWMTLGKVARLEALIGVTDDGEDLVDLITRIHGLNAELTVLRESLNEQVNNLEADYATKHKSAQEEMIFTV